jgi:hypothetical protein
LPVIVSSDGAVIAIRMGQHTANPGRVYCRGGLAGSRTTWRDGYCDIDGNMAREVLEETGLVAFDAQPFDGYFMACTARTWSRFFVLYHFADSTAVETDRARSTPISLPIRSQEIDGRSCHSHRRSAGQHAIRPSCHQCWNGFSTPFGRRFCACRQLSAMQGLSGTKTCKREADVARRYSNLRRFHRSTGWREIRSPLSLTATA